jgi:hypothetical protein
VKHLEPLFVNVSGAHESIPPGWESIPGLLYRGVYKYGPSDLDSISELCDAAHAEVFLDFDGLPTLVDHLVNIEGSPSCTHRDTCGAMCLKMFKGTVSREWFLLYI